MLGLDLDHLLWWSRGVKGKREGKNTKLGSKCSPVWICVQEGMYVLFQDYTLNSRDSGRSTCKSEANPL